MNPNPSKHVFLIGLRGSGKSTLAPLLADRWHRPWHDTDVEIMKQTGQSIRAIIETQGEEAFRDLESACLERLIRGPSSVMATGGGMILRDSNRSIMRQGGWVIWLHASIDTLWERIHRDELSHDTRPPLSDQPGRDELQSQIQSRLPLYDACADLMLDTTNNDPATLVNLIEKHRPSWIPCSI